MQEVRHPYTHKITQMLFLDNVGFGATEAIEASNFAFAHGNDDIEAEAAESFLNFGTNGIASDADVLIYFPNHIKESIVDQYPRLEAYLDKCFEAMT